MAKWKKAEIERISRDHSDVGEALKVNKLIIIIIIIIIMYMYVCLVKG